MPYYRTKHRLQQLIRIISSMYHNKDTTVFNTRTIRTYGIARIRSFWYHSSKYPKKERFLATTRQELVHQECDKLVAEAVADGNAYVRPTVSVLLERGVRGGRNDIQQDIHAWHLIAFRHHLEAGRIDGVPPELVSQFQGFWQTAKDAAHRALESERLAVKTASDQVQGAMELLASEKDHAWAAHALLERKLSDAENTVAELERQIVELKSTVIAKDERIQGLNDHLASTIQAHGVEIARIQAESASKIAELEDARKYAIAQIDVARQNERKAEEGARALQAKLDDVHVIESGLRQRAAILETDLASLKAVHAQTQAGIQDLQASRDEAISKIAVFGHELQSASKQNQTLSDEIVSLKAAAQEREKTIASLQGRVSDLETKLFAQKR